MTVTATYTYDALDRLKTETYSDSTPSVTINYDETTALGVALSNTTGRRSSEYTGPSTSKLSGAVYSYDSMSRVVNNSQCTSQNCATGTYPVVYTYDLSDNMLTKTDGAGHTFTSSYNRAERLSSLSSSLADTSHPGTLISGIHYNSFGISSANLGNGIAESYTYTARGWTQSLSATLGATSIYSFSITNPSTGETGYSGNGDLLYANDNVNGNWTYTYDDMNRLVTSGKSTQAFSYVYDRFGNRWQQNVTVGTGPNPSYSFDANNRITGAPAGCTSANAYCYDAAGNMMNDGSHSYIYDAENRIVSVDGGVTGTYVYDAGGMRVRKTSSAGTVNYIYDLSGHAVTELNTSGGWNRVEIYAAGRHVASYVGGNTLFAHSDWLGTERKRTTQTGAVNSSYTSLAFGDGLSSVGSSPLHFTGQMRDAETGLDEFPARYYSSTQGRWLSPDWSPAPVAVPYADLHDPRTLNLYAYVGNDPTNHPDADGHLSATQPAQTEGTATRCSLAEQDNGTCGTRPNSASTAQSGATDPQQVQVQKQEQAAAQVCVNATCGDYAAQSQNDPTAPPAPPTPDPAGVRGDKPQAQPSSPSDQTQAPIESRGRGKPGKGERGKAGKPAGTPDPGKHAKPSKAKPGQWLVKDPHTGKWVLKPPGWKPMVEGAAAVGTGYIIYRTVRMLPSLAPPLWWTIPENLVIP